MSHVDIIFHNEAKGIIYTENSTPSDLIASFFAKLDVSRRYVGLFGLEATVRGRQLIIPRDEAVKPYVEAWENAPAPEPQQERPLAEQGGASGEPGGEVFRCASRSDAKLSQGLLRLRLLSFPPQSYSDMGQLPSSFLRILCLEIHDNISGSPPRWPVQLDAGYNLAAWSLWLEMPLPANSPVFKSAEKLAPIVRKYVPSSLVGKRVGKQACNLFADAYANLHTAPLTRDQAVLKYARYAASTIRQYGFLVLTGICLSEGGEPLRTPAQIAVALGRSKVGVTEVVSRPGQPRSTSAISSPSWQDSLRYYPMSSVASVETLWWPPGKGAFRATKVVFFNISDLTGAEYVFQFDTENIFEQAYAAVLSDPGADPGDESERDEPAEGADAEAPAGERPAGRRLAPSGALSAPWVANSDRPLSDNNSTGPPRAGASPGARVGGDAHAFSAFQSGGIDSGSDDARLGPSKGRQRQPRPQPHAQAYGQAHGQHAPAAYEEPYRAALQDGLQGALQDGYPPAYPEDYQGDYQGDPLGASPTAQAMPPIQPFQVLQTFQPAGQPPQADPPWADQGYEGYFPRGVGSVSSDAANARPEAAGAPGARPSGDAAGAPPGATAGTSDGPASPEDRAGLAASPAPGNSALPPLASAYFPSQPLQGAGIGVDMDLMPMGLNSGSDESEGSGRELARQVSQQPPGGHPPMPPASAAYSPLGRDMELYPKMSDGSSG